MKTGDGVRVVPIHELRQDETNANKGTQRGRAMLETSVRRYGAGRSVLADKNNRLIAGNKTFEAAEQAGIEEVILVPFTGKQLVVAQRTDLDLETDVEAKELGVVDNQAGSVGLAWDATNLQELEKQGVDMRQFFREPEWAKICKSTDDVAADGIPEMELQPFEEYNYLMVVFKNSQDWQGVCDRLHIQREHVLLGGAKKIGLGRVIDGARLLEQLCTSSSRPVSASASSETVPSASSPTPPSASEPPKPTPTDA